MNHFTKEMLSHNKQWVKEKLLEDANYFTQMSKGQKPPVLWIGCADSRVPANEITGSSPGEIFVHRNIANMVVHTDLNILSVLEYAVHILKVSHIVICGHYGCGGIQAALQHKDLGLINKWVRNIKDVYRIHQVELDMIKDITIRLRRLVELNVQEQVRDLSETSIVQKAWARGQELQIHGWVYDLASGLLQDQKIGVDGPEDVDELYVFENL